MKKSTLKVATAATATAAVAVLGVGAVTAAQAGQGAVQQVARASDTSSLTQEQASTLGLNRDEERMARDLYTTFADTYGDVPVFSHIANSEQRHFDIIGSLLDRYNVADPAQGKATGSFDDQQIQKLFGDWKKQGLTSRDAALQVGIALEKRDIADLTSAIAKDNPADVEQVYEHLLAASEHHLAAFTAASQGDPTAVGVCDGQGPRGQGNGAMGQGRGPGMGAGNGHGPGMGTGQGMGYGPGAGAGHGYGTGMSYGAGQS